MCALVPEGPVGVSKNQFFVGQIFFLQISLSWRDVVLNINLGICRYLFYFIKRRSSSFLILLG
jgi:hypothetical protein